MNKIDDDRARLRMGLAMAVEDVDGATDRAALTDACMMLTGSMAAGAMMVRRWCDEDPSDTPVIIDDADTNNMTTALFAMLTAAAEDVARATSPREIGMTMRILTDDVARMVETYTV